MNCDKKHMLLYAVTDRTWLKGQTLPQQVEAASPRRSTLRPAAGKEASPIRIFERGSGTERSCVTVSARR